MKLTRLAARVAIVTFFAWALGFGADPRAVKGPLVTSDSWPRSTDLVSWTLDVMRIEKLEKNIETIFDGLKARLQKLPTRKQQADYEATTQPATAPAQTTKK